MRVLVVEDDPILAGLVVEALADDGHTAIHEPDPHRAILRAEGEVWDAFVLDAFGGSHLEPGAEYQAALRRFAAHGPVIVTTGRAWASDVDAREIGAVGVLVKPYDLDALLTMLEQAHRLAATPPPR